ncbi:MAG TPA: SH3 domain-containing protein [Candidatus Omnitrophota bacterium]|nr:SH3 domain-containing protein [Candidatus Omnitrophota bacterium]HPD83900.1 SH3 domain-containing protein [Candidatus Omnitrophota bacterium]HRZ02757.1 SH3 domain-containing protein [Candidatus Omnitrophota bacterium]
MIKKATVFLGIFFLFCVSARTEEKFPFLGEITADKVNVRAGPNLNFEQVCQMNKGQEVLVLEKSYGWCKIRLPDTAKCYISPKFVTPRFENIGAINANRVNIRAGAGENFSVIGRLDKGERVRIKGQSQGWHIIEPVERSYAWVLEKFVVYKSDQIPPARVVVEPSRNIYVKKAETPVAAEQAAPPQPPPQPVKKEFESFSAIGMLEDAGRFYRSKDIRHKLIVDGKTVYYLQGDHQLLNRWVHYPVKVEGTIKKDPAGIYKYAVISVTKIGSAP